MDDGVGPSSSREDKEGQGRNVAQFNHYRRRLAMRGLIVSGGDGGRGSRKSTNLTSGNALVTVRMQRLEQP